LVRAACCVVAMAAFEGESVCVAVRSCAVQCQAQGGSR